MEEEVIEYGVICHELEVEHWPSGFSWLSE